MLLFLIVKEPVKNWTAPEIDYLTYIEKPRYINKKEEFIRKEVANGNLNFIFYKNKVYLFTNQIHFGELCGTGIDFSKPFKQYITPDSLIEIKEIDFKKNVSRKIHEINLPLENARKKYNSYELQKSRIIISIGLDKDSVKGNIPKMMNKIWNDKRIRFSFVRKLTEEEREVAKAKYYDLPYDFDKVNWKVGFATYE